MTFSFRRRLLAVLFLLGLMVFSHGFTVVNAQSPEENARDNASATSGPANILDRDREAAAAASKTGPDPACSVLSSGTWVNCISLGFNWLIKVVLVNLAIGVFYIAGVILNFVYLEGVVNFATYVPDSLYGLWATVRNILATLMVFVCLYFIFFYIIGKEDTIKKFVPRFIIFALFVSFSWTFSKTLVGISNQITQSFYNQAVGSTPDKDAPIAYRLQQKMGLQSASELAKENAKGSSVGLTDAIKNPAVMLTLAVVILYAAYITFRVTILLLARSLVFVFTIIASPLLIADFVSTKLETYAVQFRSMFVGQLLVGPIFGLMLLIAFKVMDVMVGSKVNLNGVGSGAEQLKLFYNLIVVAGIYKLMYEICKSLSGSVGQMASKALSSPLTGAALATGVGAAARVGAFAGRNSIGRMARAAGNSEWVTKNQGGFIGSKVRSASNYLKDSTYDVRGSSIASSVVNRGMQAAGFGGFSMGGGLIGKAQNYDQIQQRRQDRADKKIESIKSDRRFEKLTFKDEEGKDLTGQALREKQEEARQAAAQQVVDRSGKTNTLLSKVAVGGAVREVMTKAGLEKYAPKGEWQIPTAYLEDERRVQLQQRVDSMQKERARRTQNEVTKDLDDTDISAVAKKDEQGQFELNLGPKTQTDALFGKLALLSAKAQKGGESTHKSFKNNVSKKLFDTLNGVIAKSLDEKSDTFESDVDSLIDSLQKQLSESGLTFTEEFFDKSDRTNLRSQVTAESKRRRTSSFKDENRSAEEARRYADRAITNAQNSSRDAVRSAARNSVVLTDYQDSPEDATRFELTPKEETLDQSTPSSSPQAASSTQNTSPNTTKVPVTPQPGGSSPRPRTQAPQEANAAAVPLTDQEAVDIVGLDIDLSQLTQPEEATA